ncbi:hypothetical protein H632_c1063p1 [Helicosporidium sp. ATCC 50920]|nr:hypothetical protein H632_c1063p1 [Helicosporidium sp. ATCC 50920]|eukprot:KDD74805.1 hypothetical protein H632_c1063p1 [Helicosporidium sp. ATCC 50920]
MESINGENCKGSVRYIHLDLTDLESIRQCADSLNSLSKIDILILNAGILGVPLTRTGPGWESIFATNHMGHFYLTKLLLNKLKENSDFARIVALSSMAHHLPGFDIEDLNWERRPFTPWKGYVSAKSSNLLFIRELDRRLKAEGASVEAFSVHPGIISNTNLMKSLSFLKRSIYKICIHLHICPTCKNVEQGAATTVFAAVAPEITGMGGAYLDGCGVGKVSSKLANRTLDVQLWEKSEMLLHEALEKGF